LGSFISNGGEEDPDLAARMRREWNREVRGHEEVRRARSVEPVGHQMTRMGWESEDKDIAALRAEFAWDGPNGDRRCPPHGTRRYTARLASMSPEYDPAKACIDTAIEIHDLVLGGQSELILQLSGQSLLFPGMQRHLRASLRNAP